MNLKFIKKYSAFVAFILFCVAFLVAETNTTNIDKLSDVEDQRIALAMSRNDYQVTAGDVYVLAYAAGSSSIVYQTIVDSSYKLRVSNLSVLDVKGKTFLEVRALVEQVVSRNYPMSGVQFTLKNPAVFTVLVNGEVTRSGEPTAWALTRLSSIITPYVTEYSSLRNIEIKSLDGKTKNYDLFKAKRYGDFTQDPYVRPGDTITVKRLTRSVSISGAVERPGTYQLLEGEGLQELIEVYASGLTPLADTTRIDLVRIIGTKHSAGQKIYLKENNIQENYSLSNLDTVRIHETTELLPVMFIEGAVFKASNTDISTALEATNLLTIRFNEGENYAFLVRSYRSVFSAESDTKNAYIIRNSEHIPVNLNPMLYDTTYHSEYFVEADDILVVPFRQFFVTVSGAVVSPGRYPYIPDRDWNYYVSLAGGFDPVKNTAESISILDVNGKKQSKKSPITPETVITANANSFLFYFNQYAPIITTTLSVVTTFLTINALTAK